MRDKCLYKLFVPQACNAYSSMPEYFTFSLEFVEFKVPIRGHDGEVKLLRYILQNSEILKKLTLHLAKHYKDKNLLSGSQESLLNVKQRFCDLNETSDISVVGCLSYGLYRLANDLVTACFLSGNTRQFICGTNSKEFKNLLTNHHHHLIDSITETPIKKRRTNTYLLKVTKEVTQTWT